MTEAAACAGFEEDLSALLDGELAGAREAEVRAHVAGCARCSERLARLARVDAALRSLPSAEVPGDLAGRVRARIAAEERARSSDCRPAVRGAPPGRRRWIPLAATALASAAALALYLVTARPRPAQQAPAIAELERPGPGRDVATRERRAQPAPEEVEPGPELEAIQAASDEELALALDLDTLADLEVIERLELLEALAALDGAG